MVQFLEFDKPIYSLIRHQRVICLWYWSGLSTNDHAKIAQEKGFANF